MPGRVKGNPALQRRRILSERLQFCQAEKGQGFRLSEAKYPGAKGAFLPVWKLNRRICSAGNSLSPSLRCNLSSPLVLRGRQILDVEFLQEICRIAKLLRQEKHVSDVN
jgi:hypothetical protein